MKFHDADWHIYYRTLRLGAARCSRDGAWAFGVLGFEIARLHRDLPIIWHIGPFIGTHGGNVRLCRIKFIRWSSA